MRTYEAITAEGTKVLFSVLGSADVYDGIKRAKDECDRRGWMYNRKVVM